MKPMTLNVRGSVLVICALAATSALVSCGDVESSEQTKSALLASNFEPFINMAGGNFWSTPAVALSIQIRDEVGVGWGTDSRIWFSQNDRNQTATWTGWTPITPNVVFTSAPSAVIPFWSGTPIHDMVAMVARQSDNRYYIRIQGKNGSPVLQDWAPIGNGTFASAPQITWVLPTSFTQPLGALVVFGLGMDSQFWTAKNVLSSGNYNHANWTGWSSLPTKSGGGFGDRPGAAAYRGAEALPGLPSLVVVGKSQSTFFLSTFNGSTWSSWSQLGASSFFTGAPAVESTLFEGGYVTVYGRSASNAKVYQATARNTTTSIGTFGTFTAIPGSATSDSPMATSTAGLHDVVIMSGIEAFTSWDRQN